MAKQIHTSWFRLILDCLLVLAVIFSIFAYRQPGHANVERQSQTQEVMPDSIQDFGQQSAIPVTPLETGVISNTVILANETIAAVIAVENAALTPPQYLSDLPIISR